MNNFKCPYKSGDSCLEGSGKPSDDLQKKIIDEYRLQAIYQYTQAFDRRLKGIQVILLLNSVAIIVYGTVFIISQLL